MTKLISYKRHRYPPPIIAHAVWLYFRFSLSLRLVEEMLLERGVVVSCETVRRWAIKFGPEYTRRIKRKRPSRHDIWHLDEVVVSIAGEKHWLWRAVDQDGYVLDEVVQVRRDTKAAKRLLKRLLKKQGCPPRRMSADKLVSYTAARRQILPRTEHRSRMSLNNRAENSHLPLRRRERAMQGFRSPRRLQSFTSVFSAVRNLFVPLRCRRSALATHLHRLQNHGDKGLRRLLTSIGTRIDVHPNHVIVALDRNRLIDALGRDHRDAAPAGAGEAPTSNTNPTQPEDRMILSIPATLQRAGHELRFVIAGDQRTPDPDPALLRILARAHVIRDRLFTVEGLTIEEVAVQGKLTPSYITRLLRLTFLAPDILTGILNGAQPPALTAVRLMADTCLPLEWHEQRIKLGLDA